MLLGLLIWAAVTFLSLTRAREERNNLPQIWSQIVTQTAKLPSSNCEGCPRLPVDRLLSDTQLASIRIKMIKQDILNKLGLARPPKVNASIKYLPDPIRTGILSGMNSSLEDTASENERMVIFANEYFWSRGLGYNQLQLGLQLPAYLQAQDIVSSHLWVHPVVDDHDLRFPTNCVVSSATCDAQIAQKELTLRSAMKDGWIQIDFTWSLISWLEYRELCQNITVKCDSHAVDSVPTQQSETEHKPFLVVTAYSSDKVVRGKRNLDCENGATECCRDKLRVTFKDIGWGNWIIQPLYYDAYYCKGPCSKATSITLNTYYNFIEKMKVNRTLQFDKNITPCCSPTKMAPLSLLYVDNKKCISQHEDE